VSSGAVSVSVRAGSKAASKPMSHKDIRIAYRSPIEEFTEQQATSPRALNSTLRYP
jgi:hypothetical protein